MIAENQASTIESAQVQARMSGKSQAVAFNIVDEKYFYQDAPYDYEELMHLIDIGDFWELSFEFVAYIFADGKIDMSRRVVKTRLLEIERNEK